ncbi:hypothetical protein [Streptomyces fagopyri]|uniref:hypothetical protein n=1 Tax=Streptomyces fagopyri TaxID=2662397 RepID=UPI003400921C
MNLHGDANLRAWTQRFMALLAADAEVQLAWLVELGLETEAVVEEAEFFCRICEGLTERGVFEPENLRDLQAIGRCLAGIDDAARTGLWADALVTDPAWDAIRHLARQFLLTALGDWRQPLPRPLRPRTNGH